MSCKVGPRPESSTPPRIDQQDSKEDEHRVQVRGTDFRVNCEWIEELFTFSPVLVTTAAVAADSGHD